MKIQFITPIFSPARLRFASTFTLIVFVLALFSHLTFAQKKRPKIITRARIEYAGRLLLLPRDNRPVSWKFPQQVGRIADYDVITPPRELLGDATTKMNVAEIIAWVKKQNFAAINGVIIGFDAILQNTDEPKVRAEQLSIVNWIRKQNSNLPIYGFVANPTHELSAIELEDLQISSNPNLAALLVARFLNRNYERLPKIQPVVAAEYAPEILKTLQQQIASAGAQIVTAGKADAFLFILPPNTDEAKKTNFADTLAQTLASGYYVALVDLSGNPEELLTILRARKQLDLLQSYAAGTQPEMVFGKALAQISTRLLAAKVLRANLDEEQLRRTERAHVELLLSRYLEDGAYAINVRAELETFIRHELDADPQKLGAATERAEAYLQNAIQTVANQLFNQQFKFNVHSVLLKDGSHIDFQVVILQRCRARLPLQKTDELELDIGIHLPAMVGLDGLPLRR